MDKTLLTLAVDSSQVGTAAFALERMATAGNSAASTAGKVTQATANQGRIIGQTLIPALNRGAESTRTLLDAGNSATASGADKMAKIWADAARDITRSSDVISQVSRTAFAAPRGGMTMTGQAPRAPLAAPDIVSAATGQRVSTSVGFSTSEMTVEASRAQGAIERLTNAAREQRSALSQAAASASATADAYRELAAVPVRTQTLGGPTRAPIEAGGRPASGGGQPGGRPAPNGGGQGGDYRADQLQQLTFQLNDLFVQIASGGSVLTALIQQGSQLSGTFGGVRPAFQAILSLLTPMRVAAGGTAIAVGALAFAYRQASEDSKVFRNAAVLTGNFAGQTEGQFNALAQAVADNSRATVGSAREMAEALLSTGQVGPQAFDKAAEAATRFSQAYKKTAGETAGIFAKLAEDPGKVAAEFNKSMNLFSAAELEAIEKLQEGGAATEAQIVVLDKLNERLRKLDGNLDGIDRALNRSKQAFSAWWAEVKGDIGDMAGFSTAERTIAGIAASIEKARAGGPGGFASAKFSVTPVSRSYVPDQEFALQDQLEGQKVQQANVLNQAARGEAAQKAKEAADAVKALVKRGKPQVQYKEELEKLERSFKDAAYGGVPVSAEDQKTARAQLAKDFAPPKGPKGNSASQLLAAQLQNDLRQINDLFEQQRDAFQFQNEFIEAAYRNGNISIGTLLDQRRQVIEDSARAEIASLDKEEARLKQYLGTISDKSERTQVQGQIEEVGSARQRVELRVQRDVVLLNEEGAASYRALSDQVVNYRANLLQMQGDEAGAAALRAQTVITNARMLAAQAAGLPGAEVDVTALERAIAITDQFNEVQRQASLLAANSARAEEAFVLAAEQQGRSLLETERGIYEVRVEELKQLGVLAAKARELAEASTDPRIKAFAADLALEYAKAADAIDPALNRLRDASRQLAAGIANTAGQAPTTFAQEYTQRRMDSSDEVAREREVYSRRIEMLEGYLATTQDKNDQARLRERIKQAEADRDNLKGESRGSSALKALNDAVLQPMAEQVFDTVNKLLITDPLQKYLEGQLRALTEGDGMLAGFFKDALGIQADPKQLAEQQQTAAITASTSALGLLASAAQSAATALNSRSPAGAVIAAAGQPFAAGDDPSQAPAVSGELAGAQTDAAESALELSRSALSATSDLTQLANAAGLGGGAMARLPGIVSLFQSAVALLSTKNAAESGGSIFGTIAGMFGASAGAGSYEAAAASTGIFHSGGVVGQPPATRSVAMSVFAGAPRYHTGGIVGQAADKAQADLKPNEVAAILMGGPKGQREEVITADDPRHRDNLGMSIVARIMAESKHEGLKVRGARELGGPVSARSMYRVNEKGPELLQVAGKQYLMTGAQGGKVLPNEGGPKGERPVEVHNHFAVTGPVSHASQQQIAGAAARGVKRGMRNT